MDSFSRMTVEISASEALQDFSDARSSDRGNRINVHLADLDNWLRDEDVDRLLLRKNGIDVSFDAVVEQDCGQSVLDGLLEGPVCRHLASEGEAE